VCHFPFQGTPKCAQIKVFGIKKHLATPIETWKLVFRRENVCFYKKWEKSSFPNCHHKIVDYFFAHFSTLAASLSLRKKLPKMFFESFLKSVQNLFLNKKTSKN
jgi:hypothetical protein